MPGGESTTISLLASHTPGLLEGLKAFVQDPEKAVWGTCAGMILMSDEDRGIGGGKIRKVDGGSLGGWGGIKGLRVWRNLYGSELPSPFPLSPMSYISSHHLTFETAYCPPPPRAH